MDVSPLVLSPSLTPSPPFSGVSLCSQTALELWGSSKPPTSISQGGGSLTCHYAQDQTFQHEELTQEL